MRVSYPHHTEATPSPPGGVPVRRRQRIRLLRLLCWCFLPRLSGSPPWLNCSVCILRSHHTRAIPHLPKILPMHRCRRILVAFYSTLVLSSTLAAYHLDATLCHACRPCGPLRPRPSHNCCPHHNAHKPHSYAGVPMHHRLRSRSFLRCIGASHHCLFGLPPSCTIAVPHDPVVPHARALSASVARTTRPRPFTRPTA